MLFRVFQGVFIDSGLVLWSELCDEKEKLEVFLYTGRHGTWFCGCRVPGGEQMYLRGSVLFIRLGNCHHTAYKHIFTCSQGRCLKRLAHSCLRAGEPLAERATAPGAFLHSFWESNTSLDLVCKWVFRYSWFIRSFDTWSFFFFFNF